MRARFALALAWLALLALAGVWLGQRLQLSGDLRAFMPAPETPEQQLLIDELGDGPGARLLLVALSGAEPQVLARQSRALHAALRDDARIELVANGEDEAGLDAVPQRLRPYRYLLSPGFDRQPLDADTLRDALDARLQDLGSPAAALVEPLLPSDPTLETLALAEAWTPASAPQRLHGVWFDRAGREALLLIRTHAAGFDPAGQGAVVEAIRGAFANASAESGSRLTLTGPGAFSVEIGARTAGEAARLAGIGGLGLLLLFWFAYRSGHLLLLGVLPLATAALAGIAAVTALFGGMHGITLAFGFTLIGVAQDYPVHLFSHLRDGESPRATARALWPTLLTGVLSTCIAYLTFLVSGVDGLRQLAAFTVTGLLTAALATRFLLPALLQPGQGDAADAAWLQRVARRIDGLPRPRTAGPLLAALALVCAGVAAFAPGDFWENDLSRLTPVPAAALAEDGRLRDELGAADVRYVLALRADDAEAALRKLERLHPALDRLVADGAIAGYESAARYLPSAATQRARQARLPDPDALRTALAAALAGSPFRDDAFDPFLADVETARTAAPLTPDALAGTPLDAAVSGLLLPGEDGTTALVTLGGLRDPAAVARVAAAAGDVRLLDFKRTSESLVAAWRGQVLMALALAALLLALTVWIALRSPRRVGRVLLPMGLTVLVTLALLRGFGIELTLFHLVSLILAAGLGLDYALFFERAGGDPRERLRTLHAILVCAAMTALVFGVLALSSIPVLRAIGVTVAIGVVGNFVLALLIARQRLPAQTGRAP
ncbi:MMPL family transporter [Luteimonas suaedae]|uniref:MMPL family transporter n=1 Tax=Luteimonas suaedae TaxID=2605430 RepID=UPI0021037630|nr:MMPL family transporter [Luteimonas suaedae]